MTTNSTTINANSEAYNTGYEAAKHGEPHIANPYCRGTWYYANWLAGWTAGL